VGTRETPAPDWGEFISVLPNQSIEIEKGFSNITVVNPSTTTSAKFKVLCTV
jgi:hypothetical protein